MAYFECTIGGASGDGVALIVQCDANFAGSTITADNGEDIFTETCPSASPYTVRFEGIPTGTYTISGVSQGQTFTTQFTVLDYETTLSATPEGATVLPINDIQIWLHCANIWDKTYTTLDEVLADNTTLLALISSNNAVDYMVRSTSWASNVCANQTAMGYIGNNDYCADTLLADATWCEAICNSDYFESVLNVKVPTMTSDTAPSGVASATSVMSGYSAYLAFDNNDSTYWLGSGFPQTLYYEFPSAIKVYKFLYKGYAASNMAKDIAIVNGDSGDTIIQSYTTVNQDAIQSFIINSPSKIQKWGLKCINSQGSGSNAVAKTVQFYGRA